MLSKERVDHYWKNIELMKKTVGDLKYPLIIKVVKAAISLAHGNAEVERGFSESAKNVTKDRVLLSEASVNAIQSTKDGLKSVSNQSHTVPITNLFSLVEVRIVPIIYGKKKKNKWQMKKNVKRKRKRNKDS